ncbi:hypothetical protein EVAR_29707_1 [Eumeta japonica]|uniref:Uncharacterized protein n=1 Tax=Eumeta variegata TaxID=151549 RepID=A0A4C1VWT9_EUMVA|nr:hypothetical protein EVAR_29707_1 [Eumeta japonica]
MQLTCNGCTTHKMQWEWCIRHSYNRHLVKLGLIKSERKKRCPLLTTPPHCKKSADHRKKRAHREERQSGVRAYAAIAEIAVTAGPSSRIILKKFYE